MIRHRITDLKLIINVVKLINPLRYISFGSFRLLSSNTLRQPAFQGSMAGRIRLPDATIRVISPVLLLKWQINLYTMFKELFYWMYINVNKIKTNDTPLFTSYLLICVLQMVNIETIFVFINYYLKIEISNSFAVYIGLVLAFSVMIINYFLLYTKRNNILKKYRDYTTKMKAKGQIYFWVYVILSFVIFYVAVVNMVTPKY